MFAGILAGMTWAVETILLGIALSMNPLCSTPQAMALAPFVSTFLHDLFSALCLCIFNSFGRISFLEVFNFREVFFVNIFDFVVISL